MCRDEQARERKSTSDGRRARCRNRFPSRHAEGPARLEGRRQGGVSLGGSGDVLPKEQKRLSGQYVFQHGRKRSPERRQQGQPVALPLRELTGCRGSQGGHQGSAGAGELYWEGVTHNVEVVAVSR